MEFQKRMADLERAVAALTIPAKASLEPLQSSLAQEKPLSKKSKSKRMSFDPNTTEGSDTSLTSTGEMTGLSDYSDDDGLSTTDMDGMTSEGSERSTKGLGGQNFILAPPPVFNQVYSKDDDMHDWFKQFEKYARASGWDSKTMASQAAVNFHNVAEEYFEELSRAERKVYKTVKKHMLRRMKLPGAESRNVSEYQAIQQLSGESSAQFANRIQNLVSKTPCLKREKTESSIARHFIQRSNPAVSAILAVKKFKTLREARQYAERIDTSANRNHQRQYSDEMFVGSVQHQAQTSYPQQQSSYQSRMLNSPDFRTQSRQQQ